VPVRKKISQIRICIDFCALNRERIKDNFPLSNMEMILQQVAGYDMIPLLDEFYGYNQIKVKMTDKYKTMFTAH